MNDIRIVVGRGEAPRVIQILPLPGASGGIAIDGTRSLVYVSGVRGLDQHRSRAARAPGPRRRRDPCLPLQQPHREGTRDGHDRRSATAVGADPAELSARRSGHESWPDRLAVSPNGRTLLVPLNLADAAAVIDTRSHAVRYVTTGPYPYGAAILPGGRTGLVSNEGPGTVSVIALGSATKMKDIQVGANLSHPEGIALNPKDRARYVAIANEDQVAVIDTRA